MKHTLTFETTFSCNSQILFDFHANTDNLPLITPLNTTVEIMKLDKKLKEGNKASLKITRGVFTFTWKLIFKKVKSSHLIVDVAIQSPFKSFEHEHHFISIEKNKTILRDVITFSLPFAPLSNIALWYFKYDMKKMFAYRHRETKKALNL